MKKKGQVNGMITIMITAILGLVILGAVYTFLTSNAIERQSVFPESVTLTSGTGGTATGTLAYTKAVICNAIYNSSVVHTLGTAANCSTLGAVALANATTGTYSVNYTYEPSGYIENTTARTVTGLIPVMFVLLIFISIAAYLAIR